MKNSVKVLLTITDSRIRLFGAGEVCAKHKLPLSLLSRVCEVGNTSIRLQ